VVRDDNVRALGAAARNFGTTRRAVATRRTAARLRAHLPQEARARCHFSEFAKGSGVVRGKASRSPSSLEAANSSAVIHANLSCADVDGVRMVTNPVLVTFVP
jgi:hypothetical protein